MSKKMMKTVFDWEHFALYLSGSMDFAPDGGKGWREEWTEKLVSIGINQKQIYNPCKKPFNDVQFDLDDEAAIAEECRKNEDWDKLDKIMGQIQHVDCRLVDKADLVLANFPKIRDPAIEYLKATMHSLAAADICDRYSQMRIPTYGTIHEIVLACQQHKPVFIIWEDSGKKDCSAWLMRLVGHRNVFTHIDELISHLNAISHGKKAFNANEWLLLDPLSRV